MSDVQSKKTEVKSEEVSPGRRNFLQVASRACYRYLPAIGSASCLIFTTDITNPRILQSIFAPHEELVSKVLLLNSLVGLGVYLYSRHHMQLASPSWQIIYSVGGAVMFNLGNVMFCVVTRVLLPRFDALRTVFGVASGAVFLAIVGRYLQFVDDNLSSMT